MKESTRLKIEELRRVEQSLRELIDKETLSENSVTSIPAQNLHLRGSNVQFSCQPGSALSVPDLTTIADQERAEMLTDTAMAKIGGSVRFWSAYAERVAEYRKRHPK